MKQIKLEEDITKLIPQTEASKKLNNVLKHTNFSDKIIVNIALQNNNEQNKLAQIALQFLDSVNHCCKGYITNIQGQLHENDLQQTIDFINENLPIFLETSDYQYLKQQSTIDSLKQVVEGNFKTFVSPGGMVAKKTLREDPFGLTFRVLHKLSELKISDNFEFANGFLSTKNGENILLFLQPKLASNETDQNAIFVEKLYKIRDDLNKVYQNSAQVSYYGSTIIAVENAKQIKKDIQYTVSIAMVVLLFILVFFYKKWSIPFLLFIPTIFGALIAMVFLHFLRDSISAISLGIGAVLLGITLDYSLHILTHFKSNYNIKQLYHDVTKPVIMSSLTTAVAFLCLVFTGSQALQDLGIFAAISVVSTSLFALVFIPLFYKPEIDAKVKRKNIIEKIAAYPYDKNFIAKLSCLILILIGLFTYHKVKFEKDLQKMNFQNESILKAERELDTILKLSSKSIYWVAHGENLDSVLEGNTKIYNQLKKAKYKGEIEQFSSIGNLVQSKTYQQNKIDVWNQFWNDSTTQQIQKGMIELGKLYGFKENTYQPFFNILQKDFQTVDINQFKKINALLTSEFINDDSHFKTITSLVKLRQNQVENFTKKYQSAVADASLIDRKMISETFLTGLKDNFSSLINYSFLAILFLLLLFFRNIELTILTIVPIAITWFITLGVMGLLHIEFTIFNVIISTFIFGLGVDYSIFITNALIKDYTYGTKKIKVYKASIILSVITTVLGVGVLIFAKHPALKSLSVLSLIGILTTVLVVFTIQPWLFRIFVVNRAKKGFSPIKIRLLIQSVILLIFYSLGGMLLSLFSISILRILPISKKVKYKWTHIAAAKLVTMVLYGNPFVKKKVVNKHNETFQKPAIIIANHSSALDTLTLGMITHNIVYLVNDWVYKSPVFGLLARSLGFYPVTKGVEGSIDHLKVKVKQGYSLVVFPEAKRSYTNKIGRFHKGAFFLQEQLQLDILPVYLHGNAEVMPKNDFIIYDGCLTVVIGERIAFDDLNYGTTSRERSKKISKFFKSNFLKLRETLETENYFKNILFSNYLYKEKAVQQEVKLDFEKHKTINEKLPVKGNLLHWANDKGQIDILLVSKYLDRKIKTFIEEVDSRSIAKNCYTTQKRKVQYLDKIEKKSLDNFDTLLFSNGNSKLGMDKLGTNFENIVVLYEELDKSYWEKLGYTIAYEAEKVLFLEKSKL